MPVSRTFARRPAALLLAALLAAASAGFAAPAQRDLQLDPRGSDRDRVDRGRDSDPDDRTPGVRRASEPAARTSSIAELAR
ncbi:hypothetical protein [Chitiniphilus shinanonensis]|uniref:hypothetical protein n=1 Tax=Chitiniphilus shinanonensis TaxID=553088 RepID=UPI0030741C32